MKRTNFFILFIFQFSSFLFNFGFGADIGEVLLKKISHKIPTISTKPKIDGKIDEEVWTDALVLELNYEVEPGNNIKPQVKTEVLLGYYQNHLYVAFKAYDQKPENIRARVTDRDNISNDDYVGIILDTFDDSRLTYNFYCNPLGIQAEKVVGISGGETPWDAIWNSAGHIEKDGYRVEMEIPFNALRFQRKNEEQKWGIDLIRNYPRDLCHEIGLFPRDRNNSCYMCQMDDIVGFINAKPGKNLEFDPTLSGVLTQEREDFPSGKFISKTKRVDPGLTARWRFSQNLTFSAAVNPDFSHVEADAAQLDVNNQFVLIYNEKRPFFLEDASLFKSVFNIVYTRRVADPNAGVKITGKEGKNSLAFFSVHDNRTILIFPWSQGSRSVMLDMDNLSTAFRYRRDIGKSSTLGFTITDREGENYFNRLLGIDLRMQLSRKDVVVCQWLASQTQYPEQVVLDYEQSSERLDGNAMYLYYQHSTQNFGLTANYQKITPDYRADLGSNSQVDFEYYKGYLRYTFRRNPGFWYTSLNFGTSFEHETDTHENLNYKKLKFQVNYAGPMQSTLAIYANLGKRSYKGVQFDEDYITFDASIRPSGKFYLELVGIWGDRIDYANIRAGKRIKLNSIIEYKWGKHLTLGIDHIYERLRVEAGRLYTANLSNLKLIYQFNRRTFLRTILQYANYNYNTELYIKEVDPRYRHLFSQILFSLKINPHTVLFLGYSDAYYGYLDIPLTQNNRTLFLKIGYALVL